MDVELIMPTRRYVGDVLAGVFHDRRNACTWCQIETPPGDQWFGDRDTVEEMRTAGFVACPWCFPAVESRILPKRS